MTAFADKTVDQHVKDILADIKGKGGGTLNRQLVLNVWVGKARSANLELKDRKAVVARVQSARV